MGYYRGDNYGRGDYYRGDGILGKIFGGLARTALSVIPGAGTVVNALASVAHPSLPQPKGMALVGPSQAQPFQQPVVNFGGPVPGSFLNFGGGPGPGNLPGPLAGGMKGYHLNKSTYETRGGGTSRWGAAGNLQLHTKGTVLVRNRRMNVGNARALKRSLRRVGGFARLARRVMTFTHPKAGKGKFKFKKRGR